MKEKHKPSKANEVTVKAPRKGGGEEAGRALSGTRPQGDSEETLRVKAAGMEPALVNTAAGWPGWAQAAPTLPFPSVLQAAEAVCDVQTAAGRFPRGAAAATGSSLARTANQLLGFLKDCGDSLSVLGHLGRNCSHGIILGQLGG